MLKNRFIMHAKFSPLSYSIFGISPNTFKNLRIQFCYPMVIAMQSRKSNSHFVPPKIDLRTALNALKYQITLCEFDRIVVSC